jgi:two-component system LytT family sensor kinase
MHRLKRKYTALYHTGVWLVLFFCVLVFRSWNHGERGGPMTNYQVILLGLPYIGLYYLHAYWLMPAYLFTGKKKTYVGLVLASLVTVVILSGVILRLTGLPPAGIPFLRSVGKRIAPGFFFLMVSASVGAFRETIRLEKSRKEKETEHLRTELSFLRGQVNPHFMLNVLNSMALLARKKSDLLEPVLLELAGLMNYMLYEANNEKIRLEEEIGYLKAYIDLQMLRFGDDVSVRFNAPDPALTGNICIEPMLLIPLVENAFKHGIGLIDDPMIFIDIWTKEDRLLMTVKNKYNPLIRQRENKPSGIGLKNLHKRLELIYPGNFELSPTDNHHIDTIVMESWFAITLNIPAQ